MNIIRTMYLAGLVACIQVFCIGGAEAKVVLSPLFSDNMVLQQNDNVALWGLATPGSTVKVTTSWNQKSYPVKTTGDGKWNVRVSTPAYGGPWTITFDDGEKFTLRNVMTGEVWVCSGQSNMEMPLAGWGKINNYEQEIAAADYPQIRLLQVQKATSTNRQPDLKADGDGWQICSPGTIAGFSSVGYFFAREIWKSKHIPVGMVHTSWGGTIAEAWTSGASLQEMPDFKELVQLMENDKGFEKRAKEKHLEEMEVWNNTLQLNDKGYENGKAVWAASGLDVSAWNTMLLPSAWEQAGLPEFDGVVWFRKKVNLPASWAGKEVIMSLGPIDDYDISFFNGEEIGRTAGWDKPRTYTIPGGLVKGGENTIAVCVYDGSGGGGIYGEAPTLYLKGPDGEKIALNGSWNYKVSANATDIPGLPSENASGPNRPTVLFNAMIHPLLPYAIRGAIWYQGESNADRAYQYRTLFPLMIRDWRKNWGRGDFPFYFVQLANFMKRDDQPSESAWAELREAQKMALDLPNTGMAVAIDIGDGNDIHPKNKQEVGRRLALIAMANIYGEKIPYSGPAYQSYTTDNNTIRLRFTHTDGGLKAKDGDQLKGFTIAGSDRQFYPAKATIKGDEIIVSADRVSNPVAVRYGWANNPDCNLYNGAGLPASPFRTDDWQGITFGKK